MIHYRIIIGNSIYDHLSSYPYSHWLKSRQYALDCRISARLEQRNVLPVKDSNIAVYPTYMNYGNVLVSEWSVIAQVP